MLPAELVSSKSLYFNWVDPAIFDVYILKRKDAIGSYSSGIEKKAEDRYKEYSEKQLNVLADVVMFGIPGELSGQRIWV